MKNFIQKAKIFIPTFILILVCTNAKAQNIISDSAKIASTLRELLIICRNVDFADPNTTTLGTFYKAAPYIIYRGDDQKRAWKDYANYKNGTEKEGVDEVCYKINRTVNQDTNYVITGYEKNTESEGVWHVLFIEYIRKGEKKKMAFAFLYVKNRFGLGDID